MRFNFYKIHGSGNDFIVVDNRKNSYNIWTPEFIHRICQYHTGIGGDGLLFLEKSSTADFKMRFFNRDGYESEMCVNGSRCICFIAYLLGLVKDKFIFEAGDGEHKAEILKSGRIKVQVNVIEQGDRKTFPVDFLLPPSLSFINYVNTGVPHLVLQCSNIDTVPVKEIGSTLRYHKYYQPQGTNVNFVQLFNNQKGLRIKIRTYERGVEEETLSCGSGATAAAISFFNQSTLRYNRIEVVTNGGNLYIYKDRNEIFLEGPVEIVYQGKYLKEEDS